jgi:hypothetical protein
MGDEAVSFAEYGTDDVRMGGVGLDFASQAGDVRAHDLLCFSFGHLVSEGVPGQIATALNCAGVLHQIDQQRCLTGGELDLAAIGFLLCSHGDHSRIKVQAYAAFAQYPLRRV